jgi:subtilase family serine protease
MILQQELSRRWCRKGVLLFWFLLSCLFASNAFALTDQKTVPITTSRQLSTFVFSNLPPAAGDLTIQVDLYGDFDYGSEFADVAINGKALGRIGGGDKQCNTTTTLHRNRRVWTLPAKTIAANQLTVKVTNSSGVSGTICGAAGKVEVKLTYKAVSASDLVIETLKMSPLNTAPGSIVQVTWQVKNKGTVKATAAALRLYFSTDSTITTSDTYLQYEKTVTLKPGETSPPQTAQVKLPSNNNPGKMYLGAIVDPAKKVIELDDLNNTRAVVFNLVSGQPDLQVRNVAFVGGGQSVAQGGVVQVDLTVANLGNQFTKDFEIHVFLCHSQAIGTCLTRLGSFKVTRDFAVLDEGRLQSPPWTIPASTSIGTRYLLIRLDPTQQISESNEGNNQRFQAFTVVSPAAELRILSLKGTPSVLYAGEKLRITTQLFNAGSVDVSNVSVRLYLSNDKTINVLDTYLNSETFLSLKKGSRSALLTLQATLPSTVNSGLHYIGLFVDYNNKVKETNEQNNTASVSITVQDVVELRAETLKLLKTIQPIGGTMQVQFEVSNTSKNSIARYDLAFYYSKTASITGQSILLKKVTRTLLSAGVREFATESLPLPPTLPTGSGYIHLWLDPANKLKESNETNNQLSVQTSFRVDQDSDGYSPAPHCGAGLCDCDDKDPQRNPGAKEICDGEDNDCDGQIDEIFTDKGKPCQRGIGACQKTSTYVCNRDGSRLVCGTTAGTATHERCNGKDDDCDGQTDEDFVNLGKLCSQGIGECQGTGKQVCTKDEKGTECSARTHPPSAEICDGKDNDCDGLIDELFLSKGRTCEVGKSECTNRGTLRCKFDGSGLECSVLPKAPAPEVCDRKDNDCDGLVDENNVCDPCKGVTCAQGEFCRQGGCYKPCDCKRCPTGQHCQDGVCQTDVCAGVKCAEGQLCDKGSCVTDPCKGIVCGASLQCRGGVCVHPRCFKVQCPGAMLCRDGQCVGRQCTSPEPLKEPANEHPKDEHLVDAGRFDGDEPALEQQTSDEDSTGVDTSDTRRDDVSGFDKVHDDEDGKQGCTCQATTEVSKEWMLSFFLLGFWGWRRRRIRGS